MKCLHVTPTFYPATRFGGPIQSLYGLCNALAGIPGVALRVLTSDSAAPDGRSRVPVASVPWRYPAGYDVYFSRRLYGADVAPGMLARLWRMVSWADVVHLTAVYSFPTIPTLLACRILRKPVVWSPRGALQRWRTTSTSELKYAWELVCRALIDRRQTVLHVTAPAEAEHSKRRIPGVNVAMIPNGVAIPDFQSRRPRPNGSPLRLLFMGRLHPIKGIENMFQAVAAMGRGSVSLAVCGEGEPAYSRQLFDLAAKLGIGEAVVFAGHVGDDAKQGIFAQSDLCIVPSHSENFGMVVAEALAHGVPVIASKGTPWQELPQKGCGYWVHNTPQDLATAIRHAAESDLPDMGLRGRTWMQREFSWQRRAVEMLELYTGLCQRH